MCASGYIIGDRDLRKAVAGDRFRQRLYAGKILLWAWASECASLYVYDAGIAGALPV